MLVAGQIWRGTVKQQQGEALEVVVGGTGGDGEAWHAGQDPQNILCISSKLAQKLNVVISNLQDKLQL